MSLGILVCVTQGSLNVWDLSFFQAHFTICGITSYLSLSYCITFTLSAPIFISMSA